MRRIERARFKFEFRGTLSVLSSIRINNRMKLPSFANIIYLFVHSELKGRGETLSLMLKKIQASKRNCFPKCKNLHLISSLSNLTKFQNNSKNLLDYKLQIH